jgi:hypothetical protein
VIVPRLVSNVAVFNVVSERVMEIR